MQTREGFTFKRHGLGAMAAAVLLAIGASASQTAFAAGAQSSAADARETTAEKKAGDRPDQTMTQRGGTSSATGAAGASGAAGTMSGHAGATAAASGPLLKASDLIGKEVESPTGDDLGNIQDLAVDWRSGRVPYAILSFGGILGLGDKHFAVPVSAFTQAPDDDKLLLDVTEEKLEAMEGFDKNQWPQELSDRGWGTELHSRFDRTAWWDEQASAGRDTGDVAAVSVTTWRFTDFDADRDARISREEAERDGTLSERFTDLDEDQDNQLDESEFAQFETTDDADAAQRSGGQAREGQDRMSGTDKMDKDDKAQQKKKY